MIPEFTKPTTITVVADDDCITAVTPAPSNTALIGLEVSVSRIRSSFPPDIFSSPAPITFIPYRNNASPPTSVNNPKISIVIFSSSSNHTGLPTGKFFTKATSTLYFHNIFFCGLQLLYGDFTMISCRFYIDFTFTFILFS